MDALFTFAIVALLLVWLATFVYLERHKDTPDNRVVVKPYLLSVLQIGRNVMADVLTYQITVGAPVDHDVVARQLTVTVDGVSEGTRSFEGTATELGVLEVAQNSNVVLTLVDVDDAGNYSEPAVVEFVASDTLRPSTPGAFNVVLVGERPGPVVEPETPVVEPASPAVEPEEPKTDEA